MLNAVCLRRCLTVLCLMLLAVVGSMGQTRQRLTNLPHLYIETFSGAAVTSKTVQVPARLWIVDEQDGITYHDSIMIRGRGNSTWNLAKKPYRIKFPKKTRLLGSERANAKKWTLLANHGDKSLIRNALAFYIGDLCGQSFTPATQFADLTLNGQYVGTYQISDQIDVRKKRVDIAEQDYPLADDSNITGGYLVEADGFKDFTEGVTGWTTTRGAPMTIHYPDDDEIAASQLNYIRQYVNGFERRLNASNYKDAQQGYRALVDSTSLASWYLASEIAGNPDYIWSLYFYKERDDDRLYFGPLWDFDIAFNNDNRLNSKDPTHNLMADVGFTNNGLTWVTRMWSDPWFQRLVFRSYLDVYRNGLEERLLSRIDSLAALLQQSQQLNYKRWNIRTRALREVVLYSTYDEYIAQLRQYVSARVPALLQTFANRQPDAVDIDTLLPNPTEFPALPDRYYVVTNAGTATVLDLDGQQVVGRAPDSQRPTQQWQVITLRNGYQQFVNRQSGMALTDPNTNATDLTTQLTVAPADSTNQSQQWQLVRQAGDRYNLNNRQSGHTANLRGGSAADGTPVISYTNDARNASSNNRLWLFTDAGPVEERSGIGAVEAADYALAYNPAIHWLHFGADSPDLLPFTARIYAADGHLVMTFPAAQGVSLSHLPRGVYIVSWQHHGHHSAKFSR